MKWNEQKEKKKKKTVSNSLWWLSPIDWRRRILLVYFIYLAREQYISFFFRFSPSLCFSLCGAKGETISDFNMSFCVHTETDLYIYTRGTTILLLLRYFVRNNNIISSGTNDSDLASTFDSCVWCILSVFRQTMSTTTRRSRQLPVKTANNKWLITLTRLWPRPRRNQRIRNFRYFLLFAQFPTRDDEMTETKQSWWHYELSLK